MNYQLVINDREIGRKNRFWAYFSPANKPPKYDIGQPFVVGDTVSDVIKAAQKILPTDGVILFTYLDRNP